LHCNNSYNMRKTGKFLVSMGKIVASSHDYVLMTYAVITFKCYYQTNHQKRCFINSCPSPFHPKGLQFFLILFYNLLEMCLFRVRDQVKSRKSHNIASVTLYVEGTGFIIMNNIPNHAYNLI